MRNRNRIIGTILLIGLLISGGYGWLTLNEREEPLVLYGNVDIRELRLAFRQSGRLQRLLVDEGDNLTAGQRVAVLDDEPYRQRLAAATAQLAYRQALLEKAENGSRQEDIEQARQTVTRNQVVLQQQQREVKRIRALTARKLASQQQLDQITSARDQAAAELGVAQAQLALLEAGTRQEDIVAARAQQADARVVLQQAQLALDDTRLVTPSAAQVLSRVVEPGAMVSAGATIVSLSLRDPIYIRAYVSERQLAAAVPGRKVVITTDSSSKSYHGHIGFVAERAEFTPKSVETTELRTDLVYRLRITVSDADPQLRQGMPVTITFDDAPMTTTHDGA